jgi:hypothetical protein
MRLRYITNLPNAVLQDLLDKFGQRQLVVGQDFLLMIQLIFKLLYQCLLGCSSPTTKYVTQRDSASTKSMKERSGQQDEEGKDAKEDIKQRKAPFSSVGTAKARAERENDLESSEGTARGRVDGTTTRIVRDVVEIVRESLETPRTAWRARRLLIVGI